MRVTALLVSHDGARWLPAVLAGLRDQQRRPDRVLAVDTGSSDDTVALLTAELGSDAVLSSTGSFPEAVDQALAQIDTEWVWILHDDANPAPGALAALLATAEERGAAIAGPKLREWPSLRRLLEVGITISGTGRRETNLERGEYDQGQHDNVRQVLAVNTAGMLVRRDVLVELGGFDKQLPLYGNDLDLGWRAARAGHTTLVVPDAVVFHAEAAHRGLRRTSLGGRRTRTHRHEREAALYTLLVNEEKRRLPFQAVRLVLGTLLRFLGYLLARMPGHAGDELVALLEVLGRPGALRRGRRDRAQLTGADPEAVRRLLAPWWLPYRHGLDVVSDFLSAAANQGRDAADRRRLARIAAQGNPLFGQHGSVRSVPVPDEAEELSADSGLLARLLTSPPALAVTAILLLTLWGAREALGPLAGGALSPTPEHAGDWWRLVVEGWHELGQGTDAPAPGYLLPFAAAASVLFGEPAAVVSLLFLLAVPFAGWGAWRFLRVAAELGAGREASGAAVAWGAIAYAAVPVASGAWGQGRFGVVMSAMLLPWLAHAATSLFDPSADRRWRAAWRSGLLLAVVTAFTPAAWLVVLLVVAITLAVGARYVPELVRERSVWAPLVVVVAVPPVLLLPGAIGVLGHDLTAIFLEAGRLAPTPGALDLLAGRLGSPAAPVWAGLLLVVPALAALGRDRTRGPVVATWLLVLVAAVLAAVLSHVDVELPAGIARPGLGFLVVVIQGALITAVVVAAHGIWSGLDGAAFGWRQPVVAAATACAVAVPVVGLGWWLAPGDDELHRPRESEVPAYMAQAADDGAGHGVLILRGSVEDGLTWEVRRGDGVTLGEDEVLALTGPDRGLDTDVTSLVSRPTPDVMTALAARGIDYVLLPTPADAQVAATLDAAAGLTQASAKDRSMRAWQLEEGAEGNAISGDGAWWQPVLVVLQLLAVLVVAVLCGPTRRETTT